MYKSVSNNNGFHVLIQLEEHGSGVGATTGTNYNKIINKNLNVNIAVNKVFTDHLKFKLVTLGQNNNYNINYDYHVKINANGELTSCKDNFQ